MGPRSNCCGIHDVHAPRNSFTSFHSLQSDARALAASPNYWFPLECLDSPATAAEEAAAVVFLFLVGELLEGLRDRVGGPTPPLRSGGRRTELRTGVGGRDPE